STGSLMPKIDDGRVRYRLAIRSSRRGIGFSWSCRKLGRRRLAHLVALGHRGFEDHEFRLEREVAGPQRAIDRGPFVRDHARGDPRLADPAVAEVAGIWLG